MAADGVTLGTLDMCEWLDTIHAIDDLTAETIRAGLYELRHEQRLVVTDTYDNGTDCMDSVSGWRGTRVPPDLATRLVTAASPVTVQQETRLRLLGRLG